MGISDEQCDVHEDTFLFCRLFCLTKRSLDRVLTRHLETRVEMHKCPTLKLEIGPAAVFFYICCLNIRLGRLVCILCCYPDNLATQAV